MFKLEYSTTAKPNLKKEFPEMWEMENFMQNLKSIKGFTFHKLTDSEGKEYPISQGIKKKENYKIEWR